MAGDATLPAAVITGLAVGIGFVVVFSIFFTPSLMISDGSNSAVPTESAVGPTVQDIVKATPASPPAIFSKGEAPQVVSGVVLGKMAEAVKGTKTDPANDLGTVKDNIGTGEAVTAQIVPDLRQDGYSASACYAYDLKDYSTFYCITISPIVWLRS